MRKPLYLFLFFAMLALSNQYICAGVLYVKPDAASGAWSGKTPVYTSLQAAIDVAVSGDQIWLAAGTYKPTTTTDRNISFNLKQGVQLYGGFAGTETLLTQRNWWLNKCILSGDIGTVGVDTDNSYHVLTSIGTDASPITNLTYLDGVVVEKGYANGSGALSDGGGLYLDYASPRVVNCVFRDNYAAFYGGALCARNGTLFIVNTLFIKNKSSNNGGAVYAESASKLTQCSFINNTALNYGGAVVTNNLSSTVTNSILWGNSAPNSPSINNVTCTYSCVEGGDSGTGNISSNPLFVDAATEDFRLNVASPCIDKGLNANTPAWLATDFNGAARLLGTTVDMGVYEGGVVTPDIKLPLSEAVLLPTITSVQLTWEWASAVPAGITSYEVEVKANDGASVFYSTTALTYSLTGLTPATYQWRVRGVGVSSTKDWSPWSRFYKPRATPIYVKQGGTGSGNSWADALGDLQNALSIAGVGDQVWLAAGIYKPTTSTDRNISFNLKQGVQLYGGFVGTETVLAQRSWSVNKCILSGDIGTVGVNTDNSYHVLTSIGTDASPITNLTYLDGVVVEKGYANGSGALSDGGGLYLGYASPRVVNCVFRDNYAADEGGALSAYNSTSTISTCLFINNEAKYYGGAVNTVHALKLSHSNFINNKAGYYGGAVYSNTSATTITNSILRGNSAPNAPSLSDVTCTYSCVEGGYSGTGNISTNPLFVDVTTEDFRLNATSPCINKGLNANTPAWLATDFMGAARLLGTTVDMGIYEGAGVVTPIHTLPLNEAILLPTTTSAQLTWVWESSVPAGITSYEVEVKVNNGNSVFYSTTALTYSLTGLTPATYQWRVRGVGVSSTKDWSPWSVFYIPRATPIYVKQGGSGSGNSWADAMGDLQNALSIAVSGDQIWLAAGTYKPTTTTYRNISFKLKQGVQLYGGFVGTETLLTQRNWSLNKSILSGDIGAVGVDTDNSYHVLTSIGTSTSPITDLTYLDGVVVEKGYANGSSALSDGGGLYLGYASPRVVNCVFRDNYAADDGGAIYATNSSSDISSCLFINNEAKFYGGAVNTVHALKLSHSNFINNKAGYYGGAVYSNTSTIVITNSILWGNSVGSNTANNKVSYYNCCVEGGGAQWGNISANPMFVDATGGDFHLKDGSPAINAGISSGVNTDFDGVERFGLPDMGMYEAPVVTHVSPSDKAFLFPSNGSYVFKWGYSYTDLGKSHAGMQYLLQAWEPATPQTLVLSKAIDANCIISTADLKAYTTYEWKVATTVNGYTYWSDVYSFYTGGEHPIYVKQGGTGNGSSWVNALGSLSEALTKAQNGDQIWVAAGTYKPTTGADRNVAFTLKSGVTVLGGFVDGGTLETRNFNTNKTILSGDIGVVGDVKDNSYHVINNIFTAGNPLTNAVLDGFIITGGNAESSTGGGINNEYASPAIRYCIFYGNKAVSGGAISNSNSSPTISNSLFYDNRVTSFGGAIYAQLNSTPVITNCTITDNHSDNLTGGVYGGCVVKNSIFYDNKASGNTSLSEKQIYKYQSLSYSCIDGILSGVGNVFGNPRFVDAANRDYRLASFSSCYNKGDDAGLIIAGLISDLSGSGQRIAYGKVDIGAYEMQETTSPGIINIVSSTPANNATEVETTFSLVLTFNEPVTFKESLVRISGDMYFYSKISADKKTVTIISYKNWAYNQTITVDFAEGAAQSVDNDLVRSKKTSLSFRTRNCPVGTLKIMPLDQAPCPNVDIVLKADVNDGVRSDYKWTFNNKEIPKTAGVKRVTLTSIDEAKQGVYVVAATNYCGDTLKTSLEIQLITGLTKPTIKKKWDDVYLVDNTSGLFSDYTWYINTYKQADEMQFISIPTTTKGELVVKAKDSSSGCVVASEALTLGASSTIKSLSLSPNPVKVAHVVTISFNGHRQTGVIRVFDTQGKLVETDEFTDVYRYEYSKTNLKPGVYVLEVVGTDIQSIVKLVIE